MSTPPDLTPYQQILWNRCLKSATDLKPEEGDFQRGTVTHVQLQAMFLSLRHLLAAIEERDALLKILRRFHPEHTPLINKALEATP